MSIDSSSVSDHSAFTLSQSFNKSQISVYYQNTRGINSKLSDLHNSILCCNYDFICLSETWLNSSVTDSEFCPQNFHIVRSDRDFHKMNVSKGGGVLLAAQHRFTVFKIDLSCRGFDSLQCTDVVCAKCSLGHFQARIQDFVQGGGIFV